MELERIDRELVLVPADETLQPLIEVHQRYNQELGALIVKGDELAERAERVAQTLERLGQRRERLREQIVAERHHDARVRLTDRTQAALREYARALTRKKADVLGERLVERFNDLCRKQDLVPGGPDRPGQLCDHAVAPRAGVRSGAAFGGRAAALGGRHDVGFARGVRRADAGDPRHAAGALGQRAPAKV